MRIDPQGTLVRRLFLSIQAQDFIEDEHGVTPILQQLIPEHSSSGLH